MSGETIGIIYPPPELRNIVDKTASFVARNGPEFESRIQQNEQNNPKFNFLKSGDPYNAYYQHKVKELKEGIKSGNDITAPPTSNTMQTSTTTNVTQQQTKISKQLELLMETTIIPREPPSDYEFTIDPPSISALELDIVKLTAQFVAIHGRSFLTNLMNREQRNYQFDFLRPQHGLFNYFTNLIEQYSKILMPPKTLVSTLEKELQNTKLVLDRVRYRVEWNKIQEAEKRKEEEEAEKERIQYAQIDWHDFVVVETVDYQPHEQGMFPPPTTPEQVGSRILLQQRIEEQGQESIEMDVESDEDNDGESRSNKEDASNEKVKESMPPPPLPPLPPSLDNVLIRKDYNPKAPKQPAAVPAQITGKQADAWVISPITGEKIPAEKLQEHMRYSLLDPRWVEQRDRTIQEKMQQEEVYAAGAAIESSLRQLAERRTDIFGSGDAETAIGKKIGEEERKVDKVTWDGYTSSVEATQRAARANITIEEQIQHIHKLKGLVNEEERMDKIGPSSMPTHNPMSHAQHMNQQQHQHQQQQQQNRPMPPMGMHSQHPSVSIVSTTMNAPPHPPMPSSQMMPPMMMSQPPSGGAFMMPSGPLMMPPIYGMPPMGHDMSGMAFKPPPSMPPISTEEEPASKKQKTEETLIPEDEFLRNNKPDVCLQVQVAQSNEKPEWNMNGQTLSLNLSLTDTFAVVKNKIHEQIGMPVGKQKLQYDGIFVKDSNTLAFYNITDGVVVNLALKERGGRKK